MLRFAAWLAAAFVFVAAAPADAQRRGGDGVIVLYEDPGYQGRSIRLDGEAPSLDRIGFNDRASSLRIEGGGRWEVCIDSRYRGTCQVVDQDLPDMTRWAFNDRISSVRPVRFRGPGAERGVTLYSGPDYTGRSVTIIEPIDNLRRVGFNDEARSIQVHSGVWVACRDDDYEGRCEEFSRSVSDLRRFGLDREITSLIPLREYRERRSRTVHDPGFGPSPGYGPGYGPGFGPGRIDGAVRGVGALFAPRPEVRGAPVSACLGRWRCGRAAAERLCRNLGWGEAAHYGVLRRRAHAYDLDSGRVEPTDELLVDVLCVR